MHLTARKANCKVGWCPRLVPGREFQTPGEQNRGRAETDKTEKPKYQREMTSQSHSKSQREHHANSESPQALGEGAGSPVTLEEKRAPLTSVRDAGEGPGLQRRNFPVQRAKRAHFLTLPLIDAPLSGILGFSPV